MGLRDYKTYKREKELQESETISHLIKRVDELEKRLEALEKRDEAILKPGFTSEEKEKIKQIYEKKVKPEDFIKQFTDDSQEFDPNA